MQIFIQNQWYISENERELRFCQYTHTHAHRHPTHPLNAPKSVKPPN